MNTLRSVWLRRFIILGILFLSYYSYLYPIAEEGDLSKYEGGRRSLYFVEVLDNNESLQVVRSIYSGAETEVVLDAELEIGSVVSFYGEIKEGRLIAEKHHVHEHPWMSYYLSAIALLILIFILNRAWRFDFQGICFRRR